MRGGGVRQGGSTITQQLAKTNFLSSDRTIKRKAQEVIIAFWLEAWLTKEEILSRYLSSVYFGDGVYGLRAAAHHYFNRDPEKLTLAQSAMLAGLVQAPSRLAPTQQSRGARRSAAGWCSQAMADTGAISPARARGDDAGAAGRAAVARSRPAPISPTGSRPPRSRRSTPTSARCKVRTTLDRDLQRLAVRAVARAPLGDAQAALVAMRPDGAGRRDGRRQELQAIRRSTARPRRGASPARRSSCSSISPRCAPAGRPTA